MTLIFGVSLTSAFLIYLTASQTTTSYFQLDSRYSGLLPQNNILWTMNNSCSLFDCGTVCLLKPPCLVVFYGNNTCYGFQYRMHDRLETVDVPGIVYFEPKGQLGNLALDKTTNQSSVRTGPHGPLTSEYSVDGYRWAGTHNPPKLCSMTHYVDQTPFWHVDLQETYLIEMVTVLIINGNRFFNITVHVGLEGQVDNTLCGIYLGTAISYSFTDIPCHPLAVGNVVRIEKDGRYATNGDNILLLCEVEIYGQQTNGI